MTNWFNEISKEDLLKLDDFDRAVAKKAAERLPEGWDPANRTDTELRMYIRQDELTAVRKVRRFEPTRQMYESLVWTLGSIPR